MPPIALSGGAFLAVLLPALAVTLAIRARTAGATSRLADVARLRQELLVRASRSQGAPVPLDAGAPRGGGLTGRGQRGLSVRFGQTSLGRRLVPQAERTLEQTPWQLTAFAYLLSRLVIPAGAGTLAWLLFSAPIVAVGSAAAAHFAFRAIVNAQVGKFRRKLGRNTEVVIDILVAHLRAGQSLVQSLHALAEEAPAPSRQEFTRVSRQLALGTPVSEALRHLEERTPVPEISLLVSALNLHHRTGGDLPLLLRIAADTVKDQIKLQDDLDTAAAGQLLAGYVVVALPIILFAILFLIDRPYMGALLRPGWNLLLWLGGFMEVCGFFVMRAFTRIEV